MDETQIIVELSALRVVDADEITRRAGVLNFNDVGIDDGIARARIVTFNVFSGDYFGSVPVLRLATAYDRGHGVCLSQVMAGRTCAARMGETAIVSPISDQLLENEKEIALNAFLVAKAA
ncbi:MAG: hypothetical protein AAF437_10935 [Pseudomonadota bacterium]